MFRFWKESSGLNLITFLELFLWGTLRIWLGFIILIIHILYKGWKWAGATGINLLGILLLSLLLVPPFCLTTYTTPR
jgi:membrane-bound ClpP family serine protease